MATFGILALDGDGQLRHLVYDNESNSLVGEDGQDMIERTAAEWLPVDKMPAKATPRVLKISLGLSCNYSCEYCSQRFVPRADETNSDDAQTFLAGLGQWVTTPPEEIQFWGGEPLVYVKTLKPLAEGLRVRFPDAKFTIITNGSLLNPTTNEWLDSMGFSVGVSHDGPGQHLRGPDPLQDPKSREGILDLYRRLRPKGRISFNAMINRENMSRAAVVRFFAELVGEESPPMGEGALIDAYDQDAASHSLRDDDHAKFRQAALNDLRAGVMNSFSGIGRKFDGFVAALKGRRPASSLGQKCGMDRADNLAVDLNGNVLTCQNVSAASSAPNGQSHGIGHVSDLAGAKLVTARHWSDREGCRNCPVLHVCKGSCMFLECDLWDVSCENAYSDAIPVFAGVIEHLTGLLPVRIDGPLPEHRKDIWNPVVPKRKVIQIKAL